ncbi:MAG TPA: DUF5916 domain-containing protein [Candidatus Deferrimicrobium sp.]|nr:DUF5916 domain-containing protein [Candidatus Deferrimicrobium sp.]
MKKKSFIAIGGLLLLLSLWSSQLSAKPEEKVDEIISGVKVDEKIKIDGMLGEKTWLTTPIQKKFITTTPSYGYELPMDTMVWVAYDKENLYFAFRCLDSEPDKIKTAITKRDNISGDDWVSVSVDAMGNGQLGYLFFVNPNGIQADGVTSSMHVDDDMAPDFVWESAAKITKDGYDVEIRLPLNSIGFKSGKKVDMGMLFRRRISRLSYIGAWPEIKLNRWILTSETKVEFKDLKKQLKLELLPALTHSSQSTRLTPDQWKKNVNNTEFGVGIKYGITSSTTAEITINPDFSQVESDALQVEVNQRYPLFYTEKRPFFMEGMGIFNFWTYIYGFFPNAVYTRQIVNPGWGAKLTGNIGSKFSFGILSAGDDAPGLPWDVGVNPNEDKQAFFGIARGKYGFGKDNYFGFVYTGRKFAGEYNHLFGIDGSIRAGERHWFRGSYIYTASKDAYGKVINGPDTGYGNLTYTYGTKAIIVVGVLEHIGKDLRADAGYLQRNGVNVLRSGVYYNIYSNQTKHPWLKAFTPYVGIDITSDLRTHKDDIRANGVLSFYLIKDATLSFIYQFTRENWQEQTFEMHAAKVAGAIRLNNWLRLSASYMWRQGIYYYANPAFMGEGIGITFSADIQPNNKLNQNFSFTHSDLAKDGSKIYNVNILYSKTTYQFNKYFFLRALIQYNSYQEKLLTDFLASFTLIPGTVLHLGYGGMYERRDWIDSRWVPLEGELYNIKRSFFAKVSYLWRF